MWTMVHGGGRLILCVLLASLPRVILCLKDVVLQINPNIVHFGEDSTLRCSYDLEGAPLYCVKWYRGSYEFYRYTPKELPSTKIFPRDGIRVDLKQSNEHQVVLREVGFSLSGTFTCEVTTDGSIIKTAAVSKDMLVVALPAHPPTLSTDKSYYYPGDDLVANCTSPPARPAATLTFMINDVVVCEKCEVRKHPQNQIWWSELSFKIPVFPKHFHDGKMVLKCIAKIEPVYEENVQMSIYNVKDPVPAKVTQSSAGCHYVTSFTVINILLLLFFSVS